MTDELDELITTALHRRAAAEVDIPTLVHTANARGARAVRRRRVLIGAGGTAAALVLAVAVAQAAPGVQRPDGINMASPDPSQSTYPPQVPIPPGPYTVPALPVAAGVPGAAAAPQTVGKQPTVLHFDIGSLGTTSASTFWSVADGVEEVHIKDRNQNSSSLRIGQSSAAVNFRGRDMTLHPWTPTQVNGQSGTIYRVDQLVLLRWQPAAGVWALAQGRDEARARAIAGALRLDRAQRCVLPFRPGPLPPGAVLLSCSVNLLGYGRVPFDNGGLTYERPGGGNLALGLQPPWPSDSTPCLAERRIDGRKVCVGTVTITGGRSRSNLPPGEPLGPNVPSDENTGPMLRMLDFDGLTVEAFATGGLGEEAAARSLTGAEVLKNRADPKTWPVPPTGR